jgi:hypothetical protein
MGEGWAPGFKIVGNRQAGCIHDINADQSGRGTEHLIDTTIIINLLRTSSARDNPLMHFLIVMLLFPLINHSCLMIALNIICTASNARTVRESSRARARIIQVNFSGAFICLRYMCGVNDICTYLLLIYARKRRISMMIADVGAPLRLILTFE